MDVSWLCRAGCQNWLNPFVILPLHSRGGEHGKGYRLPADFDLTRVWEIIFQRVKGLRCACSSLWGNVQCDPPLLNTAGHLFLRHESQWECVFGLEFLPIFTTNARNEILPSHETVIDRVHGLYQSLCSLMTPQADIASATFTPEGLLTHRAMQDMCDATYSLVWENLQQCAEQTPWLTEDQANLARMQSKALRLVGGCWDKYTHRQYAVCQRLMEERFTEATLFGDKFQIWGCADTPTVARHAP